MSSSLEQLIRALPTEKRALLADLLRPPIEPIAVIGMACRYPGNCDTPDAFWSMLANGRDAIGEIPAERWNIDQYYDPDRAAPGKMYSRWGGFLRDIANFDAEFFGISPGEALRMDPQQRMLVEVAWDTLEHAGYSPGALAGSSTGVFLGIMTDDYQVVQNRIHGSRCLDDPYCLSGSACSMAAGRLSHLFDFHGPAVNLDTACSSSLVTTHLACQSLRAGECDLALTAGVYAIVSPDIYIQLSKANMLSADGRCKSFDAAADGFVAGEGCGMLALKRLSDAIRDGDSIAALIRGSAVNEDGRSMSITAPNGHAQQELLRRALSVAGAEPSLVDYIEAHGSGTALGDPIEIEALGAVLGPGRPAERPLLIGSVKTNIGHLIAGAGAAGLIKTVLSLQHAQVPPHLNLRTHNPRIGWDTFPVRVPSSLEPWPQNSHPRSAGVSSFSWSGTNAHIFLEQAPTAQPRSFTRRAHVLPLAAKDAAALERMAARLAAHHGEHPELELGDAAYTLQVGRSAFPVRAAVVGRDWEHALGELRRGVHPLNARESARVAFLFAGVGEPHPSVTNELYRDEPAFREEVDRCLEILQRRLSVDLRAALYPDGARTDATPPHRDMFAPPTFTSPESYSQPALFVIEYSLARILMRWGVQPDALLGYSLGEYVAACVAGVLSLDDALWLVTRRAQILAALPAGAMLAVSLEERAIEPWLREGVELAAVNSPAACVVAGTSVAIVDLESRLFRAEVPSRRVGVSLPFHSSLLRPAAAEITALARSVTLNPPRIRYLSNLTGTWITTAQATDPTYWAEHMCRPVRFHSAVGELLDTPDRVMVEIGPGQTLASFAKQHPACNRERLQNIFPIFSATNGPQPEMESVLAAMGRLWTHGAAVDWSALWSGQAPRRVPLPAYPFAGQRYWVEPRDSAETTPTSARIRQNPQDWFYMPAWRQTPTMPLLDPGPSHECWLLFEGASGVGDRLAAKLSQRGERVIRVGPASAYQSFPGDRFQVRPGVRSDYEVLLQALAHAGLMPRKVVHEWSLDAESADALELGFYSLLALVQALGDVNLEQCSLTVLTRGVLSVVGREEIVPERSCSLGPCSVVSAEYASISCRLVDLDFDRAGDSFTESLLAEICSASSDRSVALREGRRWVRTFERLPASPNRTTFRRGGVYLITGGMGGLGFGIAERLARDFGAKLVLVGRKPADPERMAVLVAAGSEVLTVQADVSLLEDAQRAVTRAIFHFGALHGVIHAAGVPGAGLIALKQHEDAARVFAPKIGGTVALATALQNVRLDFLALFSSITAYIGTPGQADYSAANAFLNAWAERHRLSHGVTVSIAWGEWQWNAWEEGLSGFAPGTQELLRRHRREFGITFDEGFDALARALAYGLPNVVVSTEDWQEVVEWAEKSPATPFFSPPPRAAAPFPRPPIATSYAAPRTEMERTIAALWSEQLGIAEIGIHDSFFDLGGNSLVGIGLISRIRRHLALTHLPAYALYEAPTVAAMAKLLSAGESKTGGGTSAASARAALRREHQMKRRMR